MRQLGILAVIAIAAAVPLAAVFVFSLGIAMEYLIPVLTAGGMAIGMAKYAVQDRDPSVYKTKALPASGTTAVATDGIDLGHSARGIPPGSMEVRITAPALAVGELANGATVAYALFHDDDPAFGTEVSLFGTLLTQTGAGGAGAAGASKQVRLPSDCKRYIRAKGDPSADTDKSGKSFALQLIF